MLMFISLQGWWNDLLQENTYKELDYSGKMVLMLDILTMCSNMGDKALVFSQSIPTLDLIEFYLSKLPRPGKQGKFWKKGKDWYRLVISNCNLFRIGGHVNPLYFNPLPFHVLVYAVG